METPIPIVQVARTTISACLELKQKLPKGLQMTMSRSKARKASDQPVSRPVIKHEDDRVRNPASLAGRVEHRQGGASMGAQD